jgi:diketogulonate reductase-like aldo/keto reductase
MLLTIASTTTLNNGIAMPLFGLGTFRMGDEADMRRAIDTALDCGYRLFDTASAYQNEEEVGAALRANGIDRRELFITTKAWTDELGVAETREACEGSLRRLQMEYVDLYLIHWPAKGRWPAAWQAMTDLLADGKCRAIGVSNFTIKHLEELATLSPIAPAVNQVEFSPFRYDAALLQYCRDHDIQLESYSPLTRGAKIDHPVLLDIARRHVKTPAQVLLRWQLELGVVVIPKASSPRHIRENADIFDYSLSTDEVAALCALNEEYSIVNPEWRAQFEYPGALSKNFRQPH